MFIIEKEVNDSVRFCSQVMAEMYNMSIEKAKDLLTNSPFPRLIRENPVAYGHISYQTWSEDTYNLHKRLGNI